MSFQLRTTASVLQQETCSYRGHIGCYACCQLFRLITSSSRRKIENQSNSNVWASQSNRLGNVSSEWDNGLEYCEYCSFSREQ